MHLVSWNCFPKSVCVCLFVYLFVFPLWTNHQVTVQSIYNFTHAWYFQRGPRNFFCGKTENHAWHGDLPRVEKGFDTLRNSHAWQSKPLSHTITHVEETYYTHCFEAYVYRSVSDRLPTIAGTWGPNSTWEGPMTTQFSPLSWAFIQE